nr:hypothetical protein [Bradyrhizobium sp. WSM1417]
MRALYLSGTDTLRLNFSHGTRDDHARAYVSIRTLQRELGRAIGGMHRRCSRTPECQRPGDSGIVGRVFVGGMIRDHEGVDLPGTPRVYAWRSF